jgi:Mg2+/Co2+ transporter CorC
MRQTIIIILTFGIVAGLVALKNQSNTDVAQNYFNAYNAKDTAQLSSLLDPSFTIKSPFAEIKKKEFLTALNNIKQINENLTYDNLQEKDNTVSTMVTQTNDYLKYLGAGAQKTKYNFTIQNDKIKSINVDTLMGQSASNDVIIKNSEQFMGWLTNKYPTSDSMDLTMYMQRLKEFYDENQAKAKK